MDRKVADLDRSAGDGDAEMNLRVGTQMLTYSRFADGRTSSAWPRGRSSW